MAVAIRTTDIRHHDRTAAMPAPRAHDSLRTECLTPLAVTLGVAMWGLIIVLVRALV